MCARRAAACGRPCFGPAAAAGRARPARQSRSSAPAASGALHAGPPHVLIRFEKGQDDLAAIGAQRALRPVQAWGHGGTAAVGPGQRSRAGHSLHSCMLRSSQVTCSALVESTSSSAQDPGAVAIQPHFWFASYPSGRSFFLQRHQGSSSHSAMQAARACHAHHLARVQCCASHSPLKALLRRHRRFKGPAQQARAAAPLVVAGDQRRRQLLQRARLVLGGQRAACQVAGRGLHEPHQKVSQRAVAGPVLGVHGVVKEQAVLFSGGLVAAPRRVRCSTGGRAGARGRRGRRAARRDAPSAPGRSQLGGSPDHSPWKPVSLRRMAW